MTEAEWLACEAPQLMLVFLNGKVSDRKLRLFAVAGCRQIWQLLTDERSRGAVEVAERFADGNATAEELTAAYVAARAVYSAQANVAHAAYVTAYPGDGWSPVDAARPAYYAAKAVCEAARAAFEVCEAAQNAETARHTGQVVVYAAVHAAPYSSDSMKKEQAILLRDIFNPFRSVTIDERWLAFTSGTVVSLAQAIYTDRTFDRMPILADALEDAGCTNQEILGHCRGPGEHVRGCWVVDLLLGKE